MFLNPDLCEILRPFTFTDVFAGCRELTQMTEAYDVETGLGDAIINGAAAVICPEDVCPA
jgi:hypothetical protein